MSPTLEDDVARIAALRGKPVDGYLDADGRVVNAQVYLSDEQIGTLFIAMGEPKRDVAGFDDLPPASRAFIRDCPVHVCGVKWGDALRMCRNEQALIRAAQRFVDENLPYDTRHRYGPRHPHAAKVQ
jgi:hypothetical protein